MATVKVKLRPSTVPGKAGTIYYQLTHLRQVKQNHYEDTSSSQKLG